MKDFAILAEEFSASGSTEGWILDSVTSPCIDAGDPNNNYMNEPQLNGGLSNIGAYGGTPEASKSPKSGRWLIFESAGRADPLHGFEPLRWSARDNN